MLDIDSHRVRELYHAGGVEADESTDLFTVDVEDILGNVIDKNITERFTPHSIGSIELLKIRIAKH